MKQRIFYEQFEPFYFYHGSTQNWNMQGYHFHKDYEIILFMSEGARISIDNRVYSADVGDLFLINNLEYHKTTGQEGREYKRYVLMFDPDFVIAAEEAQKYPFTRYFINRPENFAHKIHLSGKNLKKTIDLADQVSGHGEE